MLHRSCTKLRCGIHHRAPLFHCCYPKATSNHARGFTRPYSSTGAFVTTDTVFSGWRYRNTAIFRTLLRFFTTNSAHIAIGAPGVNPARFSNCTGSGRAVRVDPKPNRCDARPVIKQNGPPPGWPVLLRLRGRFRNLWRTPCAVSTGGAQHRGETQHQREISEYGG